MAERTTTAARTDRTATAVVALLTALLLLLAEGPAVASSTATSLPATMPGDRILVQHRTPGNAFELHHVDLGGEDRVRLTSGRADFEGTWSPDGRHVAFSRIESPTDGLYVVPAAGGAARRLADRGYSPSWNPEGTAVATSPSTEAQPRPVRITDLAGTSRPVPGTDSGVDVEWSPDGRRIAFVSPARGFALVIANADGSDLTVTPGRMSDPVWSPGSDAVAHVRDGRTLLLTDGAGSETFLLTNRFERVQQLSFSPRGDRIAFAARERSRDALDIWTVTRGGVLRRVTSSPVDDLRPVWSASGDLLAWTRTDGIQRANPVTDVWVGSPAGGPHRRVTSTGRDLALELSPGRAIRLAGANRLETALTIARRTFPSAEVAVLARMDRYPDALAGAPLAAALGGPVLLTPSDRLHPAVRAELQRLGVRRVVLLGGTSALSAEVERQAAEVAEVTRLGGASRFETAAEVADALVDITGEPARVLIAEGGHPDAGRGWPDALAAAALGAVAAQPVLLVTSAHVPDGTRAALEGLDPERALIVGGTSAVSAGVEQQLREMVPEVQRVAGANRYETSTRVADLAAAAGASTARPWLATGRLWPDALTAGAAAAADLGVLVLVDGRDPQGGAAAHAWLSGRRVDRAVAIGGTGAVTPPSLAALEASLAAAP
jgi:dipeptidyl aminopeptidase/acylaminoacyl peptidase